MGKIITRISGGLGNQMFMYAAGRALSLRIGSELFLDYNKSYKEDTFNREYELNKFPIKGYTANRLMSFDYIGGTKIYRLSQKIGYHFPYYKCKIIKEESQKINYLNCLNKISKNAYIEGYWQDFNYFKDFESEIRQDFNINLTNKNKDNIQDNAVALCIRRYQEVKNFINIKLLEVDYYENAISIINKKITNPIFYCFTQDPKWVKDNLSNKYNIIIMQENNPIQDFAKIQLFQNFIISNSSYYWWAAFLSKNTDKIVICPNNWVNPNTPLKEWIII